MPSRNEQAIVSRFIDAMNRGDDVALADLMGEDCVVIAAMGEKVEGRDACVQGFRMFREQSGGDYRLEVEAITPRGEDVLIKGTGRASNPVFGARSLFRARVAGGRLREWQIYSASPSPAGSILRQIGQRA